MFAKTEQEAEAAAREALALMTTPGWTIRVWENMGWCWCLRNGNLRIYSTKLYPVSLSSSGMLVFHAQLSTSHVPGSPAYWSHREQYADPNEAVEATLKEARDFVARMDKIVSEAELSLEPSGGVHVKKYGRS